MRDFSNYLLSGERIVWTGGPIRGIALGPRDALLIPFGLFWMGFVVFWNFQVWTTNAPVFFRLFGLPFLLVGLYLIAGRFWVDAIIRSHESYAVTNQRILIRRTRWLPSLKSLDIGQLPLLQLDERPDGSGTISFASSSIPFGSRGFAVWSQALDPTPRFFRIEGVRKVYELIQRQKSAG